MFLDSGKYFSFSEVFLDSGKCFVFSDVFCPMRHSTSESFLACGPTYPNLHALYEMLVEQPP